MPKPVTLPRLRKAAARYYERYPTGGSLHIVLDDENIRRAHVAFCLGRAIAEGDAAGAMLARALLRATISQRRRLARDYYGYACNPRARLV